MNMLECTAKIKEISYLVANKTLEERNQALKQIIIKLYKYSDSILKANQIDLEQAKKEKIPESIQKRLLFDNKKLKTVIEGIQELISLEDPLGRITLHQKLDDSLTLLRQTCPLGVIGVIFEARPDALVQIASLCIKSGNCAILKGGTETFHTNKALFVAIHSAILESHFPSNTLVQVEERTQIIELLQCHNFVDLLIPRGSNAFVKYIMENTYIPVMGHSDGICHIYVDKDFSLSKALPVIIDAKTQYTSACNSTEVLLVHKEAVPHLFPALYDALREKKVQMKVDSNIYHTILEAKKNPSLTYINSKDKLLSLTKVSLAKKEDFHTEYLDLILAMKTVESLEEAILHINQYGSHHTDCILSENEQACEVFMNLVDSASVYKNCSTRFADGFRYGFGAEVGISTGKLHARGPVGLEGLCTYKYKLYGNGDIVKDYVNGKKKFCFKKI